MLRLFLSLASLATQIFATCIDMDIGLGANRAWSVEWGEPIFCNDVFDKKVAESGLSDASAGINWCQLHSSHTLDRYIEVVFGTGGASGFPYPAGISGSDSWIDTWCGYTCASYGLTSGGSASGRAACGHCLDVDIGLGGSAIWRTAWGEPDGNCSTLVAGKISEAGGDASGASGWCTVHANYDVDGYSTVSFGIKEMWPNIDLTIDPNTDLPPASNPVVTGDDTYAPWVSGSDSLVNTWCGSTCGKYGVGGCSTCVDREIGLLGSTFWTATQLNSADCSTYAYANASLEAPDFKTSGRAWCESIQTETLDTWKTTMGITDWTYPSYVSGSDLLIETWCAYTCSRNGVIACKNTPPSLPPSPTPPLLPAAPPPAGFPVGAIVGIVVGAVVVVIALGFLVWMLMKKKTVSPAS